VTCFLFTISRRLSSRRRETECDSAKIQRMTFVSSYSIIPNRSSPQQLRRMEQASPPPSNATIEQPGSRNKSRRLSQVDEGNILESRKRKRGQGDEEVSTLLLSSQTSLPAISAALESRYLRGRRRGNNFKLPTSFPTPNNPSRPQTTLQSLR